jgi:hypothetical protein
MSETKGTLTTRDTFLRPAKRRFAHVDLPDGQRVRIRSLTEREKSEFEADILTTKGVPSRNRIADANRRLIVLTLVDENGDLLLQPGDVASLEQLDGAVTGYLADEIGRHCGFAGSDIEGLVKNSQRIADAASASG